MTVLWEYSCDQNHFWNFKREVSFKESPDDDLCPNCGQKAVALHKMEPVDFISVNIKPAASIIDNVTKKVGYQKRYFLIIGKYDGSEEYISKRIFSWEEIQNEIYKYKDCSIEKFLKLFGKKFQKLSPTDKLEIIYS